MPRLPKPDALARRVGTRIKQLREAAKLTMEQFAHEAGKKSKGHISNVEQGLSRPTLRTLYAMAKALNVKMLDIVTFPDEDDYQAQVEALRLNYRPPSPGGKATGKATTAAKRKRHRASGRKRAS